MSEWFLDAFRPSPYTTGAQTLRTSDLDYVTETVTSTTTPTDWKAEEESDE